MSKLFILALLLVMVALFAHMTALHYAARSAKLTARAITFPAEAAQLKAERSLVNQRNKVAFVVGMSCAILSGLFAVLSHRAEESAPRTIVVLLLGFYGILLFAVV